MTEVHITLFPFGPVNCLPAERDERTNRLNRLIFKCGADVSRNYEFSSIEDMERGLRRLQFMMSGTQKPLVVCTKCSPLHLTILRAYAQLTRSLPLLKRAMWVIAVDSDVEPFLWPELKQNGSFDRIDAENPSDRSQLRVWRPFTGEPAESYVILTERTNDPKFDERIRELWQDLERPRRAASGMAFPVPSRQR